MVYRNFRWCFFAVFLLAIAHGSACCYGQDEHKYALLIATNDYLAFNIAKLQYAENDQQSLKEILESSGYLVSAVRPQDREDVVREFARLAQLVQPEDTFVLFFAGHGFRNPVNHQTYILTRHADPKALDVDGIRLSHLLDFVSDIPASHKLVLLDHCYSGDAVPSDSEGELARGGARGPDESAETEAHRNGPGGRVVEPPDDVKEQQDKLFREAGIWIVAASRNLAYESNLLEGHGVLTHVLIRALRTREADTGHDRRVQIEELARFVEEEVPKVGLKIHQPQQVPRVFGSGGSLVGWVVVRDLPESKAEQRTRIERYEVAIGKLLNRGMLRLGTPPYDNITAVLRIWERSVIGDVPIPDDLLAHIGKLEALVEGSGNPMDAIETLLENPNNDELVRRAQAARIYFGALDVPE